MSDKAISLMGLMRKANAIQFGEDNTGAAVKGGKAKLLLVAADASDNARKRAEGFAYGRNVLLVHLPYAKQELSAGVGLSGCSMAAVTDLGFANALMKELAASQPERYVGLSEEIAGRHEKARRRKAEKHKSSKNKSKGLKED